MMHALLVERIHRSGHGEIGLAGARRSDPENHVMFLNGLDIGPLAKSARDDRRLAGRSHDLCRREIAEIIGTGFVNRVKGVIEFVTLDIDSALSRVFQFREDLLGFRDLRGFAFHSDPTFTGRDFHAERFLQVLDQFEVVRIKRLHGPGIFKLQSARFNHLAAGISSAARIRLWPEECQTVSAALSSQIRRSAERGPTFARGASSKRTVDCN